MSTDQPKPQAGVQPVVRSEVARDDRRDAQGDDQRDALAESERKSSEDQPRSYDERNVTDKVVHINPPEPDSDESIQGLDPKR